MSDWIKYSDRLPALHRFTPGQGWNAKPYVLGCDTKGRMGVGFFVEHSGAPNGGMWTCARSMGEVTYWMPLPKAPLSTL